MNISFQINMEATVKMDITIIIYRFKKYISYYLVLISKKHGIIMSDDL